VNLLLKCSYDKEGKALGDEVRKWCWRCLKDIYGYVRMFYRLFIRSRRKTSGAGGVNLLLKCGYGEVEKALKVEARRWCWRCLKT